MRSGDRQCMILILAGFVALAPGAYAADCQDSPCGPSFEHMSSSSDGGSPPAIAYAGLRPATGGQAERVTFQQFARIHRTVTKRWSGNDYE